MFDCKRKLSDIFERNVEGIEVSVNCMKQEKNCAVPSKVRLPQIKGKEIKDQGKIMENLYQFYENVLSNDVPANKSISNYLKIVTKTFCGTKGTISG